MQNILQLSDFYIILTKYNSKISIRMYDNKLHFVTSRERYVAIKEYTVSQNNVKKNNETLGWYLEIISVARGCKKSLIRRFAEVINERTKSPEA